MVNFQLSQAKEKKKNDMVMLNGLALVIMIKDFY